MKYVDIKDGNYSKDDVNKIAESIKLGEIAIIPTDTVYGISVDALNEEAVKKVYDLKNRQYSNPMNILVSNMQMIENVTKGISNLEKRIMEKFFPGALTVICQRNNKIPEIVTAGLNTIRYKNARR